MLENKLKWVGKWVWLPDRPPAELNIYARFRKTFELSEVPEQIIADISADSRYMLYVNGQFVCRGVPMCDPLYQYYDQADIAPYLKQGMNTIAVLVHHYGISNSTYQFGGKAGLLFEAQIGDQFIATDASWKTQVVEAYTQNVPRICATHMLQGFQEHFDARLDTPGWEQPDFDDSQWPGAVVISSNHNDTPPIDPWPSLVTRDIPHYFEEERPAAKIYRVGKVEDAPLGEDNDLSAKMQAEPMQCTDVAAIKDPEAMVRWDDTYAEIYPDRDNPDICPSVIIDFGKEVTGMPKIEVEGPEGAIIDIALAEITTSNGINHYWGNLIGMGVAHRYVLRYGKQSFETFGRFGFRFIQLTFRNLIQSVKVHRVSMNFSSYDVGNRGSFECSDPLLNEVWKTGAYTTQLCMYDGWEDCPGREQRQWVGDARVEALINYACFGDLALTRKFLIQTGQSQRADGMTMMFYPGCVGIVNSTIVDYNLQWIMTVPEYHLYSGDDELVRELYPKVILSMGWWEKRMNVDGLLENVPSSLFMDTCIHGTGTTRGILTVLNCLYLGALRSAAKMARMNGDRDRMRKWQDTAKQLENAINERLFDKSCGIYKDALVDGELTEMANQHSNLLPLLMNIVPAGRQNGVWSYVIDESRLWRNKQDQEQGKDVIATQPFFTYFLFELFARRGKCDLITDYTRRLYKPMIDAGHGTLWETWFNPMDDADKGTQSSMCHAWAATPTFHLSSDVLGVRPTSPGFAAFDIRPHPAGLEYAKGVFPSIRGDIEIAWQVSSNEFRIEFSVPGNTVTRVVLPVANPQKVTMDGVETNGYVLNDGGIEFTQVQPGRHEIALKK